MVDKPSWGNFYFQGSRENLSKRLINKSRETPTVRFLGWRYITHQSERERQKKWNFKKNLLHWILPASAELCSYTIIACSTHWFTFELLRKNIQFLITTTYLLPIALTCILIFPSKGNFIWCLFEKDTGALKSVPQCQLDIDDEALTQHKELIGPS